VTQRADELASHRVWRHKQTPCPTKQGKEISSAGFADVRVL
jgi:hypothetical protein